MLREDKDIQGIYENYLGNEVYGVYRAIPDLSGVVMATEQATAEALAPAEIQTRGIFLALGFSTLIAIVGAYLLTRRIARPIDNLTEVAEKVTAGDLDQLAVIEHRDQIGTSGEQFQHHDRPLARHDRFAGNPRRNAHRASAGQRRCGPRGNFDPGS